MHLWKNKLNGEFKIENYMLASLVTSEICKLVGKNRLRPQSNYLNANLSQEKLLNLLGKNIFIIGCGGKAHELIAIFMSLC